MYLHTENDLPDALRMNPFFTVTWGNYEYIDVLIHKKVLIYEPTRDFPCEKYPKLASQELLEYELILKNFSCQIPILFSGSHLNDLFSTAKHLPICGDNVTKEALDLILAGEQKSFKERPGSCNQTKFALSIQNSLNTTANFSTQITVIFDQMEVELHQSYISYDLQNLIGEVGGVLGLTLGMSGLSLFDSITQSVLFFLERFRDPRNSLNPE